MSGDFFALITLGALLLFILWEMWQGRRGASKRRAETREGFVPGAAAREVALFVLALVFGVCGVLAALSPELTRTGSQTSLVRLLQAWLGPWALAALFFVGAVIALLVGLAVRRKRRVQGGRR